jgi:hypothetical protein
MALTVGTFIELLSDRFKLSLKVDFDPSIWNQEKEAQPAIPISG